MKKEEIVQLLHYRRHDLANDIQVIHGYASMGMFDNVQEKLEAFMQTIENERKLHMIAAPSFILWIEQFRIHYNHFSLTYDVKENIDLSKYDEWITEQCEKLMQEVQKQLSAEQIYNVHITVGPYKLNTLFVQMTIDQIDQASYERLHTLLEVDEQKWFEYSDDDNELRFMIQID